MSNLKNIAKAISDTSNDPTTGATNMNTEVKAPKVSKSVKAKVAAKVKSEAKAGKLSNSGKTPREIVAERIASMSNGPTSTDPVVVAANAALSEAEAPSTDNAFMLDISTQRNLPVVSAVQAAIDGARKLLRRFRSDVFDGIVGMAEQVIAAKAAAKKEGVKFESLFGDYADPSKFPFSQNWANTIVRVYESKLLTTGDFTRLPTDLTALATLASTKPDKREALLARYEELRSGDINVIEGEVVIGKLNTQKAMKRAKAEVADEEEIDVTPKKVKEFDATRVARKLFEAYGVDGLSDLADAIELLLVKEGVR
jgi:hypothetical protein